ncbi:DUF1446 domain-containing protein [Flavobacteriaceae bacterium]|nr:DUF1446 domain-containing protein [Flavobacteriaceae bacterium]
MKKIRIGSGAGYAGDRLEPALDLMQNANLDYICFECLAERTIAMAQQEKMHQPDLGYNAMFTYRMERVLPLAMEKGVKVITNMGAANPEAALQKAYEIAQKQGIKKIKIAAVLGDQVLSLVQQTPDLKILESGAPLETLKEHIFSANAYLGVTPILAALEADADIIITGRVADPSLFLAPMIHAFGWDLTNYDLLGKGTLVGHLLECAGQLCGGYFADTQKKQVPKLEHLGFPYAEINAVGEGFVSKLEKSGGSVTTATCTEQLLYEIHDPAAYITPDCVADFSAVEFSPLANNKIAFSKATGKAATAFYKVSVGYKNGFIGEGQISYAGADCLERAKWAAQLVQQRIQSLHPQLLPLDIDYIGWNSVTPNPKKTSAPPTEVRLRVAGKTNTRAEAQHIANEVEALYTNGPAGGGGASKKLEALVSIASVLLPKDQIDVQLIFKEINT